MTENTATTVTTAEVIEVKVEAKVETTTPTTPTTTTATTTETIAVKANPVIVPVVNPLVLPSAPVEAKRANGKKFGKKKINRFSKNECKEELARLEKLNDTDSKYYVDVLARSKKCK